MSTTVYSKTILDAQGGKVEFTVHRHDEGGASIIGEDADGGLHFCGRFPTFSGAVTAVKAICGIAGQ